MRATSLCMLMFGLLFLSQCKSLSNKQIAPRQGANPNPTFTNSPVPLDAVSLAKSINTNTNLFQAPPLTSQTQHPNAMNMNIWYSRDLQNYAGQNNFRAPIGAHAIASFSEAGQVGSSYAVMIKTGQGQTGWQFSKLGANFTIQNDEYAGPLQGEPASCTSCHGAYANSTDFLGHFSKIPGSNTFNVPNTVLDARVIAQSIVSNTNATKLPPRASSQHPNAYNVETWYSSNLRAFIGQRGFRAPTGSFAVKRFNEQGKNGYFYTLMIKTGQGQTGWQFTKLDQNFQVEVDSSYMPMQGEPSSCLSCHRSFDAATDYLAQFGDLR